MNKKRDEIGMKLETRRQKERRRRIRIAQQRITFAAVSCCVVLLAAVFLFNRHGLSVKNREYQSQIASLNAQIEEQKARTTQLQEKEAYTHTKQYVESIAQSKFGLIYPDEIVFRPVEK